MRTFIALCLLHLLIGMSEEKCNITEDKVFILHGEYQTPVKVMPITVCNASDVNAHQPIKMEHYENYFKIEGSLILTDNKEKLPVLYSHTFSEMSELKTITVTRVGLEEIETNAFKGLMNLKYLDLRKNKLTVLDPLLFADLSELRILNIQDNKLNTIVSHQFQHLINLRDLYLNMNELASVPEFWQTGLSKLEYLTLAENQLSVLKGEMFHSLINLDRLRLHSNSITLIEKDAFKGLLKLDSLTMEYNSKIDGDLLHELNNLPNLTGIALTPYNFYCEEYLPAMEYLQGVNVEVVEIPYRSKCLSHN